MYPIILAIHSWNRWLVLATLVAALGRAYRGWLGGRPYRRADHVIGGVLIGSLHLQVLLGLVLHTALSPWTQLAFRDMGAAMRQPELRFWAVQHVALMLVGTVLAQVGRVRTKRASPDGRRHRLTAVYFSLALLFLLAGLPWTGRPWFRV